MSDTKQLATVLFFNRGFGFGELQDRTCFFIHHSDILGKKMLHEGDIISCVVVPNDHPKHPFKGIQVEIIKPVELVPAEGVRS